MLNRMLFFVCSLLGVMPAARPQVEDCEERYQIHLKSVNGPIDVLLINKDPAAQAPVTLPVPPPRDLFSVSRRAASSEARHKARASQGTRLPEAGLPAEAASSRPSDLEGEPWLIHHVFIYISVVW